MDTSNAMSLLTIKGVAALAILLVAFLGGVIPFLAARRRHGRRFLSLGNSLAGGIFLGAGFIHLLPEAGEVLEEVAEYPVAPLLAATGVGMLLLLDRVVFEHLAPTEQAGKRRAPIYPLILLVVLSIHSVIAGVALGLESAIATSVIVMVGILCHKGSAAFALMASAASAGADRRRLWRILSIFALMTPGGIVLGTVASGLLAGPTAELLEGVFNALAAGTFIYVAILDVINVEMSRRDDRVARFVQSALSGDDDVAMPTADEDRVVKFVLIVVGLAGMAVLGIWI